MLVSLVLGVALAGEPEAVIVVFDPKGKLVFTVDGGQATERVGSIPRYHVAPGTHEVAVFKADKLLGTFPVEVAARHERRCRWEDDSLVCYANVDLDAKSELPPALASSGAPSTAGAFGWGVYGYGVVPSGAVVSGTGAGDADAGPATVTVRVLGGEAVEVLVDGRVVATVAGGADASTVVASGVRLVAFRAVGETAAFATGRLLVAGGAAATLLVDGRTPPRVAQGVDPSAWTVDPP